jgi:hypothetical protein
MLTESTYRAGDPVTKVNTASLAARLALALASRPTPGRGSGATADDIGGLVATFREVARPDEDEPFCFIVGLDCGGALDALEADRDHEKRDGFAFYDDHALLIQNPTRNASLGTLLRTAARGLIGQAKAAIPHHRFNRNELAVVLAQPPHVTTWPSERFMRLTTGHGELWYWIDFVIDEERDLSRVAADFAGSQS